MTDTRTEKAIATKHVIWGVLAGLVIVSATLIALFGDDAARSWAMDLAWFFAGMLVPGSPVAGLARRAAPVVVGALLVLVVGCSPSALRTHRAAAGVTAVVLAAGRATLDTVGDEVIAACAGDAACEQAQRERIADAEAAFTLADAARGAYSVTIDVAREIGEGDFLAAVGEGAMGLLVAYYHVRAALCRLGYELPEPPRMLVQAVTWAAGSALPDVPTCVLAGSE